MDIRRFGIGHRRQEGPAGTHGVDGQSIHTDYRGVIGELAFRPRSAMALHSNPNLSYFIVIEGGGFVQVGDERARVAAGEAVVWPQNVVHAAWTELTPMRAVVVEFAAAAVDTPALESGAPKRPSEQTAKLQAGESQADGALAPLPTASPPDRGSSDREPW
jgi:quercetin dioxygenase-like cupin family protein